MGIFKDIVNTLIVTPTKRTAKATASATKAAANVVKAGAQAVSGNGSAAKSTIKKAGSQIVSSAKGVSQYNDIKRATENPKIVTATGAVMTVVGGVLTATGYGAAVGAPLMAAGAKVSAVGAGMTAAQSIKQGAKDGDLLAVAGGVTGVLNAAETVTGNEKIADLNNTYNKGVGLAFSASGLVDSVKNIFSPSIDKAGTNSASVTEQKQSAFVGSDTLAPYYSWLDRALIWLFNLA